MSSDAPDWAALAEANEREHRRRKLIKVGGAAAGVVVVAALVATAIALQPAGDADGKPAAGQSVSSAVPVTPDGASAADSPSASASVSGSPSGTPTSGSASPTASAAKPSAAKSGSPAASASGGGPAPAPGGGNVFQLSGNATIGASDGHNGPTLQLHSSPDSYAQAGSFAVDTNRSFTVSAVIRNNAPTGGRAVISQGDGSYYSFDLGRDYWTGHNQWVFKVQQGAGGQDNTTTGAFSPGNATTGQWVLLTGVFDAEAKKISLYVDGSLAQTVPVSGIWAGGGSVQIGRTRYKGQWSDAWDGAIGDVQIWSQALPASAVAQLRTSGGTSAGVPASVSWLLP